MKNRFLSKGNQLSRSFNVHYKFYDNVLVYVIGSYDFTAQKDKINFFNKLSKLCPQKYRRNKTGIYLSSKHDLLECLIQALLFCNDIKNTYEEMH